MQEGMEPVEPRFVNPPTWTLPKGYNNGVVLGPGRVLFIAGQVAWDEQQRIVGKGDFVAQFRRSLANVRAIVEAAGGRIENIGRLTIFVTDKHAYVNNLKDIGTAYRDVCGKHFPAMTLVQVAALLEDGAMVEIEATAVLP